jgi:hypothetical protein
MLPPSDQCPEDVGNTFHEKVGKYLPEYTASHPKDGHRKNICKCYAGSLCISSVIGVF